MLSHPKKFMPEGDFAGPILGSVFPLRALSEKVTLGFLPRIVTSLMLMLFGKEIDGVLYLFLVQYPHHITRVGDGDTAERNA